MQDVHKGFVCCTTLAECIGKPITCTHVCKFFLLQPGLCFLGHTNLTLLNLPDTLRVAASHAGGIPLLVAALDGSSRVAATEAHKVVSCLLDTNTIPAEQVQAHEVMLWRMQGLHRYANLLCPLPIDQGTALEPDSQPVLLPSSC